MYKRGVKDTFDVLAGKTVELGPKEIDHFWSYNYDKDTHKAEKTFYLDHGTELFFFCVFV